MHANDPVEWHLWSKAVLKKAQQEHKMIFLSVGYYSCYWCHVIQRESFNNIDIAQALNKTFISVIVDRELTPALDSYLAQFIKKYVGRVAWPLNVVLTPNGYPLLGSLYMSPDEFKHLLKNLTQQWYLQSEKLEMLAKNAVIVDKNVVSLTELKNLPPDFGFQLEKVFVDKALDVADEMTGGFGSQSKFPATPQINALLTIYKKTKTEELKNFLVLTLDSIANEALHDHLNGGFFRYTVDPNWQEPHFEKMLYDNVNLAGVFLRAARILKRSKYEFVARKTLDFIISKFVTPSGGLVSSLSSINSQGEEGGNYLWSNNELDKLFSQQEIAFVKLFWQMDEGGFFDDSYLPKKPITLQVAAQNLDMNIKQVEQLYVITSNKLLDVRQARGIPVDHKILAAWNGLALVVFTRISQMNNSKQYSLVARAIRDYLVNRCWDGQRLVRVISTSGVTTEAGLEDYVYVAQGLLEWFTYSKNKDDIDLAYKLTKIAWEKFYDSAGWHLADEHFLPGDMGKLLVEDGYMNSPSAELGRISLRLAEHFGDKKLRDSTINAIFRAQRLLLLDPFVYASYISVIKNTYRR